MFIRGKLCFIFPWPCSVAFKWKDIYTPLLNFTIIKFVAFTAEEYVCQPSTLKWRHKERDGVSNHRRPDCLLNRLLKRRSKRTSKLRVTGRCEGNSWVTGEFSAKRVSNAANASIWWRHHVHNVVPCNSVMAVTYREFSAPGPLLNKKAIFPGDGRETVLSL